MKTHAKPSGFRMTRARIAAAALAAQAMGQTLRANQLWNMIGQTERMPSASQRQKRKARRQRWAAGDRTAFKA